MISVQEIEVSVPTRKRRTMICPKRTQILLPSREGREKKSAYGKKQTKVKELTKMLKLMLLVPISFFLLAGRFTLWRVLSFDLTGLFHTERS